jgi:hypothetical protein
VLDGFLFVSDQAYFFDAATIRSDFSLPSSIISAIAESRLPDVLTVSASGIGHCFGAFPRPARCGASASLRACGLRSPKNFKTLAKAAR